MAAAPPPAESNEPPDERAPAASLPLPRDSRAESAEDVAAVRAFYRRILEALPAQLAVFSPEGRYEYVTPSAIADPDVRQWIVGRTDVEYAALRNLPPDVPAQRMRTIEQVAAAGVTSTFEESFTTRQGEQRWFRRFVTPVIDANGNVQHVLGYGLDITEQRRAEEQLRQAQKMEAVGRLAGGVAHDFNNLITVIRGFADLLHGAYELEDPRTDAVQSIREAADRAAGLTRQLLSFSRRAPLELCTFDAHVVVADTVNLLERVIGETVHVALALRCPHPWIRADVGQFKQVLMNLVLNARDAMPQGGTLRIATRRVSLEPSQSVPRDDATGAFLEVSVTDTGIGMSADTLAHLFEPFFTTKGLDKGTGLGLSTVYGIVTQLGGHVTVESAPGQGATFRVLVPVADEPIASVPEPPGATYTPTPGGTILVAEDEAGVRLLVLRILRDLGYDVLQASGGAEALKIVEEHDGVIDLLLTDVVMGDFGGRDLADAARGVRPGLRVLYMSGYADVDNLLDSTNPAEGFLDKPFTVDALKHAIQRLLAVPSPA